MNGSLFPAQTEDFSPFFFFGLYKFNKRTNHDLSIQYKFTGCKTSYVLRQMKNVTEFLNQTLYWQGILPVECLKHVSSLATIIKSESELLTMANSGGHQSNISIHPRSMYVACGPEEAGEHRRINAKSNW